MVWGGLLALWIMSAAHRASADAPASDALTTAQALYERASAAYIAGDYDRALAGFRESYALWPRQRTLLNIAASLLRLQRPADAANALAQYAVDPTADLARLAEVRATLEDLDRKLGRFVLRGVGPGVVRIDDHAIVIAAHATIMHRVEPGEHVVTRDGVRERVVLRAGETYRLVVGAVPAAQAARGAAATSGVHVPAAGPDLLAHGAGRRQSAPSMWRPELFLGTAALLSAGTAVYFGLTARSNEDELQRVLAGAEPPGYSHTRSLADAAERDARRANMAWGVAAGSAVTALAVWLLSDR
jgi:tetratricopeptide (TPR) repeat protein